MVCCVTSVLQTKIKIIMISLSSAQNECKDIYDAYFKTDASTAIGEKSDSDPVTVSTKLTKLEFVSGITFCENLNKFFTNTAVSQSDYLQTLANLRYGNDAAGTVLSVSVESLGERLYQLALDCIELFKLSKHVLDYYNDNEVVDIVAVLDDDRLIFGSDMTTKELSLAAVLIEEYRSLIDNEAADTGDYSATIAKWIRI